jgi:phage repressor protein C with HTH and peptisase S24 domain
MEKKSNFFERILQIIEFHNIKSVNSFAKDYLKYDSSEKINRLRKENTNPSYDIIHDISNIFEDISVEWLVTGKGPMLKPVELMSDEEIAKQDKEVAAGLWHTHSSSAHAFRIPLVNERAIAGFGNVDFAIQEQDVKDYYIIPKFKYCHIDFMIEIHGSSMYPKYNSGDVIACTIIKESGFIQWNKCHVIATKEQGILVKRIKEGEDKNHVIAISDNKDYPPFSIPRSEITGIALVVGVIRLE